MQPHLTRIGRLAFVLCSVIASGCIAPPSVPPGTDKPSRIEQRDNALLPSKIGKAPNGTGLDPRAREIENSLGVP